MAWISVVNQQMTNDFDSMDDPHLASPSGRGNCVGPHLASPGKRQSGRTKLFSVHSCLRRGGPHVSPSVAALIVGLWTGFGVSAGAMHALGTRFLEMPSLEGPGRAVGERPPVLRAEGWSTGVPFDWRRFEGRVVVLDIWTNW